MIRNLASGCPDESSLSHKPAAVGVRGCARSELEDAAAMTSTALTIAIARDPKHMVHSHFIRKCVVPVSSTDYQKERASSLGMVSEGWGRFSCRSSPIGVRPDATPNMSRG